MGNYYLFLDNAGDDEVLTAGLASATRYTIINAAAYKYAVRN